MSGKTREAVGARQIAVQGGAGPCLQSFPRARKPVQKANPLSTVRPTGFLPAPAQCTSKQVIQRATTTTAYKTPAAFLTQHGRDQLPKPLQGSQCCPYFPASEQQQGQTACHHSASIQLDGICEGKEHSSGGHTCVCKAF